MQGEKILSASIFTLAIVTLLSVFLGKQAGTQALGSARQNVRARDLIGTQATKATIAGTSFTTPVIFPTKGYDKLVLAGTYVPGTLNDYATILVEASIDDGSTYFPLSTSATAATEVDVYGDSGTNMSTSSGIPFIFPGDKTTTSGTAVTSTIVELTDVAYTHIRVSVKNAVTTSTSYLWLSGGGKIDF